MTCNGVVGRSQLQPGFDSSSSCEGMVYTISVMPDSIAFFSIPNFKLLSETDPAEQDFIILVCLTIMNFTPTQTMNSYLTMLTTWLWQDRQPIPIS